MAKKLKWYGWLFSFLIGIALLNWGLVAWFNFNLVEWMTFGVKWLATAVYSIVAIFGLIGLITLIYKALK